MLAMIAYFAMQSDPASQFDFWVGEWECSGRSRNAPGKDEWTETKAENSIKKILAGKVVEESFSMPGFDGKSVTVYDARNQQWRQTWVDSAGGYLVFTGGWKDGKMTLVQVMAPNAPAGLGMRMVFSDITKDAFLWQWERTNDDGKTWELQWKLDYKRKK